MCIDSPRVVVELTVTTEPAPEEAAVVVPPAMEARAAEQYWPA